MPRSHVEFGPEPHKAKLISIIGGDNRTTTYSGGEVAFEAVAAPVVISLNDFKWLVDEFSIWLDSINRRFPIPDLVYEPIGIDFEVGAWHNPSKTYTCSYNVRLQRVDDTSVNIGFFHHANNVTFVPRPACVISWVSLAILVETAYQLIHAAETGSREQP